MATEAQSTGADPTPQETVVEFGPEPDETRPLRRRWSAVGFAIAVADDRRAVPLAAALGAVALFASLVSEWQVTAVDTTVFGGTQAGNRPLGSGIADLGGWGAGYLAGLFLLVTATVLVMFGPAPGRTYARLVGLSSGGLLLAMLGAIGSMLGHATRALELVYTLSLRDDQLRLSYGRGLWCAVFGVVATSLALYLAGRHLPVVAAAAPGEARGGPPMEPAPVWSWRRPRDEDEERLPDEPFDLTVSPTTPFTALLDVRDEPTGRDGDPPA